VESAFLCDSRPSSQHALINKQQDREHAFHNAVGAALGAVGFIACALFISRTLEQWPVATSLGMGILIWLVVSAGLYALYALVASHSRSRCGDGPEQVTTVHRGLIGMISGDETHRRTNEKLTRPSLTANALTATSGTEDGTNGSERHR
jgi:hypothetical protein